MVLSKIIFYLLRDGCRVNIIHKCTEQVELEQRFEFEVQLRSWCVKNSFGAGAKRTRNRHLRGTVSLNIHGVPPPSQNKVQIGVDQA